MPNAAGEFSDDEVFGSGAPVGPGLPRIPVSAYNGDAPMPRPGELSDMDVFGGGADYGPDLPSSSPLGAGFRRLVMGVVPAIASVPGMGVGAAIGAAAGTAAAPLAGPAAPVMPFAGGLAGGFAGGAEASNLAGQAQTALIDKYVPPELQKALFIDPAQLQADEIRHRYASEIGGIAAGGSVFRPGLIGKTVIQKLAAALGFGALGGGMEAGHEMASGETIDPAKVAIAAAGQAGMQKPTRLGNSLFNFLPGFMKPAPAPEAPPPPEPLVRLPPPEKMSAMPLSDAEIAAAKARINQPPPGNPQGTPDLDKQGQPVRPAAPDKLYGQAGRAPQSRDDLIEQQKAADAFALAERQRQRLAGQPDTLDTQAAGRPEGVNPSEVFLDQGFPVEVQERRFVPDHQGKIVEVARVQRYDPRTGAPDPESIPYEVPVRDLKKAQYATPPRQAEDFIDRAEGPPSPENPRMPEQPVSRAPNQTFRATPPDDNTQFPGAGLGRSPFPEQPEGPGPWKSASDAESWFQAEQDRRARGEYTKGEREQEQAAQDAYKDAPASNTPHGKTDGRNWDTDEFGFVKSSKGGPVRFPDALSAAKWILKRGQAGTDQMMEPAVHPSGKGYTVRERMRTAAPPPEPEAAQETPQAAPGEPRALPGPAREKPVEAPPVSRETIAENSKKPERQNKILGRFIDDQPQKKRALDAIEQKSDETMAARGAIGPYLNRVFEADNVMEDMHDIIKEHGFKDFSEVNASTAKDKPVAQTMRKKISEVAGSASLFIGKYDKFLKQTKDAPDSETMEREYDSFNKNVQEALDLVNAHDAEKAPVQEPKAPVKKPMKRESLANLKQVPLSFSSFIRRMGGMKDPTGDLKAMDIDKIRRMRGVINNETGRPPDMIREAAVEHGWIRADDPNAPSESTINDVYDLLGKEARGEKQYSSKDPRVQVHADKNHYDAGRDEADQEKYQDSLRKSAAADKIPLSDDEIAAIIKDYRKDDPKDAIDDYLEDQARQNIAHLGYADQPETDIPFNEENDHGPHDDAGAAGFDESGAQEDQRPADAARAQEGAAGQPERSAEGADAPGPQDEGSAGGGHPESLSIPGTEEESLRTRAARNEDKRMRSDKTQKSHDFGLFDHENERALRSQKDMFGADEEITPENVHRVPRGTTLYSGLPLPEISRAIADTARWTFGEHQDFARNLDALVKAVKNTGVKGYKRTDPVMHFLRLINGSSSADIRSLARQFKSPTLNAMIDHFSKVPGSSQPVAEIYNAAVYRARNQFMTEFERALAPIIKNDAAVEQAARQVQSGKIGSGEIGQAARGLKKLMDGLHEYMNAAGMEVNYQQNYLPGGFDQMAVMKDAKGFLKALGDYYQSKGINNFIDTAKQTHDEMIFGNNGSIFTGRDSLGSANFMKSRVIGPEVYANSAHPLNKFIINDPVQAISSYIHSAVKRAEVARRFGDNFSRWDEIEQAIGNEGGAAAIPALNNYVRQMTVMRGAPAGASGLYRAEGLARTWTILARLSHTFRTIVMEPLVSGVYTGNPVNGLKSLSYAVRDLARETVPAGKKLADMRELGEFMGIVGPKLFDALGEAQWGGGEAVSRLQQGITQKFLHHTGVAQIGESRLIGAQGISQAYIRLQAQRILKNSGKLPGELLADMGIPRDRHQQFSKWLMAQHDGNPTIEDMKKGGDMAVHYRTAIGQAIRGQTMIPTNGSRPAWKTSSPLGRVMGQLSAYSHEFFEQVWMRSLRLAARAVKEEGFTPMEQALMMMPLASLPLVAAGQYLMRKGSNAILNGPDSKQQSEEEQILHATMLGMPFTPIEPLIEAEDYASHGQSPLGAIEGPALGLGHEVGEASGVGYRIATHHPRPGDSRKAANMLYQDILAPSANMLISTVAPVSPASIIGIQAINSNRARDMFTDSLVGPPKNKRGGASSAPSGRNGGGRNGGGRNGGGRNGGGRNGR